MKKQHTKKKAICDYCGGTEYTVVFSSNPFSVVSCKQCNLSYLFPQLSQKEVESLYTHEYFCQNDESVGYTDYNLLKRDLKKEASRRLELIKKYATEGRLLDAGCGFGEFLKEADRAGFTVAGCDISQKAISHVRKVYGFAAKAADITSDTLPKGPFDVICAWDVIEHLRSPKQGLSSLLKVQKKGGYLFMTTPNIKSIDAKILGKFWYGFKRIPEHLYYFSPATISNFLQSVGYEPVAVKPWGFQRNFAYCIQQVARYNIFLHNVFSRLNSFLPLHKISLFFPFIDMMVIARKSEGKK